MPNASAPRSMPPRFILSTSRFASRAVLTTMMGIGVVAFGTLTSCGETDSPTAAAIQIFKGVDVPFGNGSARTEVAVRGTSVVSAAVVLSASALDGLPTQLPPMQSLEFILPFPTGGPATVFDHVGVNWQPTGHPPMDIYTTPHFDVHFYMVTQQQRDAISPADPQYGAKSTRQPSSEDRPLGYTLDPNGIPRMGVHAGAADAPEYRGRPFTTSFIYGFFDGSMIFLEPMLTRAFLLSRPDTTMRIATPARYPRSGAYATTYNVRYDTAAREYRIELRDFVVRP